MFRKVIKIQTNRQLRLMSMGISRQGPTRATILQESGQMNGPPKILLNAEMSFKFSNIHMLIKCYSGQEIS